MDLDDSFSCGRCPRLYQCGIVQMQRELSGIAKILREIRFRDGASHPGCLPDHLSFVIKEFEFFSVKHRDDPAVLLVFFTMVKNKLGGF